MTFDQIEDDYSAISYLLQPGVNHGLVVEVIASYVQERQSNVPPKDAAWSALYEWDC